METKIFEAATSAGAASRAKGHAVAARFDRTTERLIVSLHNGVELAVPVRLIEGLAGANPDNLSTIEITPSGLGLHWPQLDADVYVPALLSGVFGSNSWAAQQLGARGGKTSTPAKTAPARRNGNKGGRPRKAAPA